MYPWSDIEQLFTAAPQLNDIVSMKHSTTYYRYTPLQTGANCHRKYRSLIAIGADSNRIPHMRNGMTNLHIACMSGTLPVVRALVANGADVNALNRYGETPLMFACENKKLALVRYLTAHGANVNAVGNYCRTPLKSAVTWHTQCSRKDPRYTRSNSVRMMRWLISKGADVNATKVPAIVVATNRRNIAAVHVLLEAGADVNAQTSAGRTALIYAASRGYVSIVRTLLLHGADPTIATRNGQTALSLAQRHNHDEVVATLESHSSEPIHV